MTDPDDLKTLLSPATGLAALPLEALHAALAEHIAALVLRAQAHILAPVESFEPQRPTLPAELRIRALTRSAADAALCLARLPRRTARRRRSCSTSSTASSRRSRRRAATG